ncbi:hypothetical protein RJT34_29826 [Clitoria ternatea]|uniref:F-box domain-containing protein n=1 Tax=Clitoria ternatea TaxID=43366 RepID=A0AAN9ETI0_CLITE
MGQSPSTPVSSSDHSHCEISYTDQFAYSDADSSDDSLTGCRDYTAEIPNECLAKIFQFLTSGNRKNCYVVCRRWVHIDNKNRHRLSLNAQANLLDFVPSLFSRFDSVTKLALRCDRKATSINDDTLILISLRYRNLVRLKLHGCREVTEIGMASVARNCNALKKLLCASCVFGAMGVYAFVNNCTVLEKLSVKRLRGFDDDSTKELVPQMVSTSLKSICLKELIIGQSFTPLIIGSKKLQTLRLFRCLGDCDFSQDPKEVEFWVG